MARELVPGNGEILSVLDLSSEVPSASAARDPVSEVPFRRQCT